MVQCTKTGARMLVPADINMKQAGTTKTYLERMDDLIQRVDNLLTRAGPQQGLVQAGTNGNNINTEEQRRNIRQAAILNNASDKEILDTMVGFMSGEISMEYLPWARVEAAARNNNKKNVMQAAISKSNQDDDLTRMQTLREFGGLS